MKWMLILSILLYVLFLGGCASGSAGDTTTQPAGDSSEAVSHPAGGTSEEVSQPAGDSSEEVSQPAGDSSEAVSHLAGENGSENRSEFSSETDTGENTENLSEVTSEITTEKKAGVYTRISQEEAKRMMALDDGHVVVDVRRRDEYLEGHIPGAVLIPNENIEDTPPSKLPDKDQIILIYCRSGRRSKEASQKLADMGYTRIYEFGGIIDWTGDVVEGKEN